MTLANVGMGANLGDPKTQLDAAWQAFDRVPQTRPLARSSVYRSSRIGYANQPDFFNCVAKLDTALGARELLSELQQIEDRLGRVRSFRDAPRTIDLDLLLYGTQTIDAPDVKVPHPRMHQRAFVLAPLVELEPGVEVPGRGAAADLLRACTDQHLERIAT